LSLNGFTLADDARRWYWNDIGWHRVTSLDRPWISIDDPDGIYEVALKRDELRYFEPKLIEVIEIDVTLSLIAHALISGPAKPSENQLQTNYHPAVRNPCETHPMVYDLVATKSNLFRRWVTTTDGKVPFDPHLIGFLNSPPRVRVYGFMSIHLHGLGLTRDDLRPIEHARLASPGGAVSLLHGQCVTDNTLTTSCVDFSETLALLVSTLKCEGAVDLIELSVLLTESHGRTYKPPMIRPGIWNFNPRDLRSTVYLAPDSEPSDGITSALHDWHQYLSGSSITLRLSDGGVPPFAFIADVVCSPQVSKRTLLAQLWQDILGPTAIPFDPVARNRLIQRGLSDPLLGPHVRKWQRIVAGES
jgi:hypothetical protein